MRPEFVAQMIDRMMPSSAHNWVKAIRGLIQHAIAIGLCKADPTQGVRLPKLGGSIHTWTEEEIARFQARHSIGTKARLALELALGPRSGAMTFFVWVGSTSAMASYLRASQKLAPSF